MDAAVTNLEVMTALAKDNGKWRDQHSRVGPRDMLTELKKVKSGRTVLDAGAEEWLCGAKAMANGWPVHKVKTWCTRPSQQGKSSCQI